MEGFEDLGFPVQGRPKIKGTLRVRAVERGFELSKGGVRI